MSIDLQKLTVPQLKALCREKRLTGYSKLLKPALIEKLAAACSDVLPASSAAQLGPPIKNAPKKKPKTSQAPATARAIAANDSSTDQQPVVSSSVVIRGQIAVNNSEKISPSAALSFKAPEEIPMSAEPHKKRTGHPDVSVRIVQESRTAETSIHAPSSSPPSEDATDKSLLRPRSVPQTTRPDGSEPSPKRRKVGHDQDRRTNMIKRLSQMISPQTQVSTTVQRSVPQPVNKEKTQATAHTSKETAGAGKRYISLVIKSKNTSTFGVAQGTRAEPPSYYPTPGTLSSQHSASIVSDGFFEIPAPSIKHGLSLKAIILPPPLSQRKFAAKLAIILRDINREDMPSLTLTSRLFRYSAYLSAANHLKRWYTGERLDKILDMKDLSVGRMSLWDYRRSREEEIKERKKILNGNMRVCGSAQVLGRLIDWDVGMIEDGIWRRDDPRGLVVALRFLLTRCYFCVSLSYGFEGVRRERIFDVQEVVNGEIWCITMEKRDESRGLVKFYVLEATCEVIGSPIGLDEILPLRGDWSGYIKKHMAGCGVGNAMRIMDCLRWTNHEEYDHGISKVWLKRVQGEGEAGKLKIFVARRYILACTMANSLSGRYMTSNEMEQELSGLTNKMLVYKKAKETRINLFVPAHHHIESVDFTSSMKRPLHSAVAIVQTPSREYFILKENGMQIGCEEEGIAEVWMDVIGCGPTGEDNNN